MADHGHAETLALRVQFDTREQQKDASTARDVDLPDHRNHVLRRHVRRYTVYRNWYPEVFAIAVPAASTCLGAVNTGVLLLSSFTMVMAVRAGQLGQQKMIVIFLILTLLFGGVFLGVKAIEWKEKFDEHHIPGQAAFHLEGVTADQGARAALLLPLFRHDRAARPAHGDRRGHSAHSATCRRARANSPQYYTPVDVAGLYWHFVDVIWIFLFPLLYLIDRHLGK